LFDVDQAKTDSGDSRREARHDDNSLMRQSQTEQQTKHFSGSVMIARLIYTQSGAAVLAQILAETLDPAEAAVGLFEGADGQWTVEIHFLTPPDEAAVRDLVALALGADAARALCFESVADRDWVAHGLRALAPVTVGRFVVHGRHCRMQLAANRIGIEIEAAQAFGTGHHGTTGGCLLALDRIVRGRRPLRILDIGTGSGVLAIAAAKALHRPVVASELDSHAVAIARANARANGVGALIEVIHTDSVTSRLVRERAPFDLVFANILLGPLRRLAQPVAGMLATRARVVLSGLLPAQANAAIAAYRHRGLRLERRILREGWTTLVLGRAAPLRAGTSHRRTAACLRCAS
jgi:ribosomal protein L11 methyltransferase